MTTEASAVPVADPLETDAAASPELPGGLLALRLAVAATGCGPIDYGASVKSLGAVAKHLGVSERTVANWKSRGMPCKRGDYSIPEILEWRRSQPDSDEWIPGNTKLARREASGDLFRATWRVLNVHLRDSADRALQDFTNSLQLHNAPVQVRESIELAYKAAFLRHFQQYLLDEEEIERLLEDAWVWV